MKKKRPLVLTLMRYYLPGSKSGGPVRTVANMVERLSNNYEFLIVTSDRDMIDNKPYEGIKADEWNQVGEALVYYTSPSYNALFNIIKLINNTPHDILYLNSFFDSRYTLLPLLARLLRFIPKKPILLAPRGEFSQGALVLKPVKKKLYIRLARLVGLYDNIYWQASSAYEKHDIIKAVGYDALNILVAKDLAPPVLLKNKVSLALPNFEGPLKVVYLSRISPMKNLEFALKVLTLVNIPVKFSIYGIVDDQIYWDKCLGLIEKMPSNISVEYLGHVDHDRVLDVLSSQDLFFLPTLGENYGHAIFEAFAAGLPALISDQTPWRNLEKKGVGWDLSLTSMKRFSEAIEMLSTMPIEDRKEMRTKVMSFALEIASDLENVKANINVILKVIKEG